MTTTIRPTGASVPDFFFFLAAFAWCDKNQFGRACIFYKIYVMLYKYNKSHTQRQIV
jgi:hypothetical protein